MSKRGENLLLKKIKLYIINTNSNKCVKNVFYAYNKESVTMDFKTQQANFDTQKWYDSLLAGEDKCGSYEFCDRCCNPEKYPCARAAHRHNNKYIRIAVIRRHR